MDLNNHQDQGKKKFLLIYWDLVYQEATIIIVYSKQIGGHFIYVVLYVGDFFFIGNNKEIIKDVKCQLFSKFYIINIGATDFILGMETKT